MVKKSSKTVVVVRGSVGQGKKNRRRARPRRSMGGSGDEGRRLTLSYYKSLANPFENSGMKLGWGAMVPTTIVQAYSRGTTQAATDGSLLLYLLPSVTDAFAVGSTSATTVGTTPVSLSNAPAIIANCGEGRVISMGIRAYPDIALTSSPGAVFCGATVPTTFVQLNTLTPNDFITLPTSHMSIGVQGCSATGRPVDPDSFTFFAPVVDANGWNGNSFNSNSTIPFSVPYMVFSGLPSGATVYFECVVNIEATQLVAHAGTTVLPDSDAESRLCDYWPSFEQMWGKLRPYLPHPGRAGEAAASADDAFLSSMWNGMTSRASSLAGNLAARSVFGATGAFAATLATGGGQRLGPAYRGYLM
jgi:hypothetical protein